MANIQKPFNINITGSTLDANENNLISWSVSGSTSSAYAITIYNNSNGSIVWSLSKTDSFTLQYYLPAHTLINGQEYKITIQVWDSNSSTATSDPSIFYCSARPTITIDPINTVASQSYSFSANYTQAENVGLKSWLAYLYDNNQSLISQSPLNTVTPLTYLFGGMDTGKSYYVEFQATSIKGLTGTSGKIPFNTSFSQPNFNASITASNTNDCGITLQWFVNQIIGKSSNPTPTYIDNDKLDLTTHGDKVYFDEGFNIDSDFTLKLWAEAITPYTYTDVTNIIVSNVQPDNVNAVWVYDVNQTIPKTLGLSAKNVAPTNTNNLWIVDSNQILEKALGVIVDTATPTPDVLWINTPNSKENLYFLKLNGSNGTITLEYVNSSFNLYTNIDGNKTLVSSYIPSGSSQYIYIQQINGVLTLNGSQNSGGTTASGNGFLSFFQPIE